MTNWPDPYLLDISAHQQSALATAFTGRISILTGGPGTGKTHTFGRIIRAIAGQYGTYRIGCASPFSKAAQVMSEYLASIHVPIRSTTIHRLLGVRRAGYDGKGWGFLHNDSNLMDLDYVVIDEGGTLETDLCNSLFQAIRPGTHVLILGDIQQLPPVGSGAPLRDMIAAGVPTGRLTELWRNAGVGAKCCKAISEGKPFIHAQRACEKTGDNLIHFESHRSALTIQLLKNLIGSAVDGGFDPIWDCQVLVAVNDRSELSRKSLNGILQKLLNGQAAEVPGSPFRVGDKVICLKPLFFEVVDAPVSLPVGSPVPADAGANPDFGDLEASSVRSKYIPAAAQQAKQDKREDLVANGEIGRVLSNDGKAMLVQLSAPARVVKVPLGATKKSKKIDGHAPAAGTSSGGGGANGAGTDDSDENNGTGCSWDMAFCITFHKSQGSQWPVIFAIIDDGGGASMVASRELIFTGISRFQRYAFTIGREATINKWCRRQSLPGRKTFLAELLNDELATSQKESRL